MRLADEIQELFEEAMREVDRLSLNAVRAAAFGVGHWLARLWPRMPCEGWQDELDWLLREYARNHLFITDQSRADIIAWVTAANEKAKQNALVPGGGPPRRVRICYGPRPQPAAHRTAHDKPAPLDPDHPALRRVGHIIMEQFPPADWLKLATSSLKRHSAPEETAKQFLQWLGDEQRKAVAVSPASAPGVGAEGPAPATVAAGDEGGSAPEADGAPESGQGGKPSARPGAKTPAKKALPISPPAPTGAADDAERAQILRQATAKLHFDANVNPAAKKRILDTLAIMYDMGGGTVSRALVVALSQQRLPIRVKLNAKAPAALPDRPIGFEAEQPGVLLVNPNQSLGAEGPMRRSPKEKPPADWRGDAIVLVHELGHLLDSLKLADAKWLNGKAPYYGLGNKDVYGANVLLENLVRKELDEYSKRMGDEAGVKPRPSYGGIPYDKDTRIAAEEYDRLNDFLARLKMQLPPGSGARVPPDRYRRNP